MTFHDGHPLGSTLFRCQYLRPARLVELCSASKSPTTMNGQESGWRRIVLRALLLGVIKTVEITWEELSKAQVYEVRKSSICPLRETYAVDARTKTYNCRWPD